MADLKSRKILLVLEIKRNHGWQGICWIRMVRTMAAFLVIIIVHHMNTSTDVLNSKFAIILFKCWILLKPVLGVENTLHFHYRKWTYSNRACNICNFVVFGLSLRVLFFSCNSFMYSTSVKLSIYKLSFWYRNF